MAIEVKATPRVFLYGSLKLPDIPGLTVEQIKSRYTEQHGELATATVTGPESVNGTLQYTFSRAIGSKG